MVTQKRDIRAMHGPAHVQAAGHGNPDLGRKLHALKMIKRSSRTALTMDDASVAGVWQWRKPWVCTIFVIPAPVPPKGNL